MKVKEDLLTRPGKAIKGAGHICDSDSIKIQAYNRNPITYGSDKTKRNCRYELRLRFFFYFCPKKKN